MKKERIFEFIWFILIVFLFLISIKLLRNGELESYVASFGIFAPVLVVILKMATLIIAPLGGTPIYVLSGVIFGPYFGFLLCLIGDVLGSISCFLIGRKYGVKIVRNLTGENFFEKISRVINIIKDTRSFIKARIAFFSVPEILAYASGLSSINFWKFAILHSIFYVPIDFVFVFFGSQMAILTTKYAFVAILLVVIISAGGFLMLYKDYEQAEGL